jgi:predicted Ser/Thr protein kinase
MTLLSTSSPGTLAITWENEVKKEFQVSEGEARMLLFLREATSTEIADLVEEALKMAYLRGQVEAMEESLETLRMV